MSIIQDALKKADKRGPSPRRAAVGYAQAKNEPVIRIPVVKHYGGARRRYGVYAFILLALVSALALEYLSPAHTKAIVKPKAPTNPPSPAKEKIEPVRPQPIVEKEVTPPPAPVAPAAILQKEEFTLAGIMLLESGSRAIINGSTVVEGDVVDGAFVSKISDNSVLLKKRNSEIVLHLK